MIIRVNKDICIGAGNCTQLAPKVFSQREDDGVVVLLDESPSANEAEDVAKAVKICPSQAISVTED